MTFIYVRVGHRRNCMVQSCNYHCCKYRRKFVMWYYAALFLVWSCCGIRDGSASGLWYPREFNVALGKPVVVNENPDGASVSCSGEVILSQQRKLNCSPKVCTTRTSTPKYIDVLTSSKWSCGATVRSRSTGQALYYSGITRCVEKPIKMNHSIIGQQSTATFWIKHNITDNITRHVFTVQTNSWVMQCSLLNDTLLLQQRSVKDPTFTLTDMLWTIVLGRWTHVTLQFSFPDVTVSIDGVQTWHKRDLLKSDAWISDNQTFTLAGYIKPDDVFLGHIQDFRFYEKILTSREIEEVYSGSFPDHGMLDLASCRCPPDFPKFLNDTLCATNDFPQISNVVSRLAYDSTPSLINDGQNTTWTSSYMNNASIVMDLKQDFEVIVLVASVSYHSKLKSSYRSATIQYRNNLATEWKTWVKFATFCDGILPNISTPTCTLMPNLTDVYTLRIDLSPLYPSDSYRGLARHVRVILNNGQGEAWFGVQEIAVNGRCACNGHASNCTIFSNGTYQCHCQQNTRGVNCEICERGYFRQSAVQDFSPCVPCRCHPAGVVKNSSRICDVTTGQCNCRSSSSGSLPSDCSPHLTSIGPSYGPLAGGTVVILRGVYLHYVKVLVGDKFCSIEKRNDTTVVCRTGKNEQEEVVDVKLTYDVYPHNFTTSTTFEFTYKGDPVIQRIEPLETFLRGGVILHVYGSNLDSVYAPVMITTMVYIVTSTTFSTICTVRNSTAMDCPTPHIVLPDNYGSRQKREEQIKQSLNNDDLEFYLGFILDGVPTYTNLSSSLPQYSRIRVFSNPFISEFTEPGQVKMFDPKERPFITIKGLRMNYGCAIEDYTVYVGLAAQCAVTDLSSNQIVCRPPESQPKVDENNFGTGRTPHVKVQVGNIKVNVGFLKWKSTDREAFKIGMGVGFGALALILAFVVLTVCLVLDKRKQGRRLKQESMYMKYLNERGDMGENVYQVPVIRKQFLERLDPVLKMRIQASQLHPDRLLLNEEHVLGKGHFGKVIKAELLDEHFINSKDVAVKQLRDADISAATVTEFLEEGLMMKDFRHQNVLSLCGIVIKDDVPMVVLPFMEHGDLKSYVLNPKKSFLVAELMEFGLQVANGMVYLSSQRFVHRDLAARNCMVDRTLCVKIADFGLSRDIYEKDYYSLSGESRALPIKWMAVESLSDGLFTSKSDVWSFGVLLWELVTRGQPPYPDVDNFSMKTYLVSGYRLDKPKYCPESAYSLMMDCWKLQPDERPDFSDIKKKLVHVLDARREAKQGRQQIQQRDKIRSDYVVPDKGKVNDAYIDLE